MRIKLTSPSQLLVVSDLLTSSVEHRLANVAGPLGGRSSVLAEIPLVSHGLLAEMLGTTGPRINLFMNRFRKRGFITDDGGLEIRESFRKVMLGT